MIADCGPGYERIRNLQSEIRNRQALFVEHT
jgi:hypothetical protein